MAHDPQQGVSWVDDANVALLTDLYELTMAASYHRSGAAGEATFDLFVRELPERRNFLVAAGLEQALDYLDKLTFDDDAVAYLDSLGLFDASFLEHLSTLRFTGEVWAVPEGEVVFAGEPLLTVTAPVIEAQLAETFLLNCLTFQTMVASKAARVALACGDRTFVDFSARRDHGADAALKAARASFIGGAVATATVLAGRAYGIPVRGTMAHSYVMRFDKEIDAFRTFARHFPDRAILLIDTFDTEDGAHKVVEVAEELAPEGAEIKGVRLDSGDLGALAPRVRKILDEGGLEEVSIIASGDMDEYRIRELLAAGAPIDSFGVGTQLGTSGDVPSLGSVYKLVEDEGGPKMKLSTGKATLPGRKQVYRVEEGDIARRDVVALRDEDFSSGRPLLVQAMSGGTRSTPREPLEALQERCRDSIARLPEELRSLTQSAAYEVALSPRLNALVERMRSRGR